MEKSFEILQNYMDTTSTLYSYIIEEDGFILAYASSENFNIKLNDKELIKLYCEIESFYKANKVLFDFHDNVELISFKYEDCGFDGFTVLLKAINESATLISLIPLNLKDSIKIQFIETVEKLSEAFSLKTVAPLLLRN